MTILNDVCACIGIARISSGVHFFHNKSQLPFLFLVIVLNTQAKTAKLITPTLEPSPAQQIEKLTSCSAWGCNNNLPI